MMSHKQLLPLVVLLGVLSIIAPSGFAQAPPPLNFGNNFFVTGDYVVAGAYNMTTKFTTINGASYALGTINVPDANAGIQGTKQVPKGGQVVAALLYWQTVEKVGVALGAPGSGQNGYFRPLLYSNSGGPAVPGYAIAGTSITGSNTVSWSSGGCSGGSTGKLLRTYRADVGGALPLDASGNPTANGSFEVRLPSSGNSTPLTLGATLVIIYRIPGGAGGPSIPLNSIVIYDGDYSQSNTQLIMTQKMQGFYDAAASPVSRLTHIVGSGQSNKFQTVYLGSGVNPPVALPSLYGNGKPAFPGSYGTWDNPTWTFSNAGTNPIKVDTGDATTKVVPSMSNQGCVSWGAVIVSTTVKNSDGDGILDSWKTNHGYCDASVNNGSCNGPGDPAWVDLSGAELGHKDIFLQYDYMCSKVQGPASSPNSCFVGGANSDYSFDPRLAVDPADGKTAVDKVVAAFDTHTGSPKPFVLHAIPGNAIKEDQPNLTCTDANPNPPTCPFPKESGANGLGTVGFREGLTYIKNQNIDPTTGLLCKPGDAGCGLVPVFQHGKKDSYHYALFSHGVGLPSWFLSDGSLSGVTQSGSKVTFTTLSPHGIVPIPGDTVCPAPALGRVTVIFAISNPNLNGTYCAMPATSPALNKFAITVSGSASTTYTSKTDPNLAVANGQVTSMSGFSDVGGQNSVISLGYGGWGPPSNPASDGNKWQTKAGTFMHELGHTLGLTHGGTFYTNLANSDYTPAFEANCKPNVQTSMSYLFQVDLLEKPNQLDALGQPLMVVDYSEQPLPTLTESSPQAGVLSNADYAKTGWYQLTSFAGGTSVGAHCDVTPRSPNELMSYVSDLVGSFFWSNSNPPGITGNDINFNGNAADTLHGHDEWDGTVQAGVAPSPGVDLQQISAVGTITTIGLGGEAGALKPAGGGGALHPAGGGGALKPAGGGGALKPAGGGGLNSDITHEAANSYARPPRNLTIVQEEESPRYIDLSWFAPTFGQVVHYNVKRSENGSLFHVIATVTPPTTSYTDKTDTCGTGPYRYEVTAVVNNDAPPPAPVTLESVASNIVPAATDPHPLTGCYTVSAVTYPNGSPAVQGSIVPITWTLTDDFYATPPAAWSTATFGHPVTNTAANKLVVHGPVPPSCTTSVDTTILLTGTPTAQSGESTFSVTNPLTGQFTFNWDTDVFCAGSYTFMLTLDSTQTQPSASALQLGIDVNDTDSTPHITTLSVPDATVGISYNNALSQHGGVGSVSWLLTAGSFPPNITLSSGGLLSGTPIVPPPGRLDFTSQLSNFTLQVSDSATPTPNVGTQAFTLRLITPVSFKATTYNTGLSPNGVIAADFDGDGKLDLATANGMGNSVSILLGNGNGTFTAQSPLVTGNAPYSLAADNFDNDNKLDLVVTNFADNTISVFLGDGDGSFQPPATYPVGSAPTSVVTGDFNGDTIVDLAVANQNDHSVSILLGNGDGTFHPAVPYLVGTSDVATVATGDFDGDHNLDLAITSPTSDKVYVLLGIGDGTFNSPVAYATGSSGDHSIAVSAVDFNGDNKLDLAVTNLNAKTVAILLGNGDGTFQSRVPYLTTTGTFIGPSAMTTGDFNGDSKVDLVVTDQQDNTVSILLGNGDGSFQSPLEFTAGNANNVVAGVAAGEFNGDGRLDLAVANQTDSTVSVMLHLPQPPTNLATTNVTSTQVALAWTASTSSGVAMYNVYRADTSGGPYTLMGSQALLLSFTDNTVTSGHTYYYIVTAVGQQSLESVKSNELSVTTP